MPTSQRSVSLAVATVPLRMVKSIQRAYWV
jgi:hypothetical protein